MTDYKASVPFDVAAFLLVPSTTTVKGVLQKTFTKEAEPFFCSFKTFGGTEREVNGIIVVEDTATVETWYDPTITADCHICIDGIEGVEFEILGTPENINLRNQYMKFKVRAIKGGA